MYETERLRDEITRLFRARMAENGEPVENVLEYLEDVDFHALTQAVRHKARTVYAYTTQGQHRKSFNYRGEELFHQRASLLYEEMDQSAAELAVTTRKLELWLLEDMSLVAVSCVTVDYQDGGYVTEYRTLKGDAAESVLCLDLEELAQALEELCWPCYEHEQPVYEL